MQAAEEIDRVRSSAEYQRLFGLLSNRDWRLDNLYRIKGEDGAEVPFVRNEAQRAFAGAAHCRNLIPKARKLGFCQDPRTRVLTADLRWVTLNDVQVGQQIVAVDELLPGGKGKQRKMRLAVIEHKQDVFETAYRIKLNSGVELIATAGHRYLAKKRPRGNVRNGSSRIPETVWRTVGEMKVGDLLRYVTQPWNAPDIEDAWYGGLLDGEGSLRQKVAGGFEVTMSQTEGAVLDRARAYLTDRGYKFYEIVEKKKYVKVNGDPAKPLHKLIVYRMNEAFHLIGRTRPTRFVNHPWWQNRDLPGKKSGMAWSEIVSIEKLGEQRMIDLQTSAKTFIAEGIVSHNSTYIAIDMLDECLFRKNSTAGIVDRVMDDATDKLAMIKFAYDRLPVYLQTALPLTRKNDSYLEWGNGSSVSVGTSYRGGTPTMLHVSEFGKISTDTPEAATEILTGAIQAVPATGRVWVESTAHGTGGKFYDMVKRAERALETGQPLTPLDLKLHFFGWWIKREYRLPVYAVTITHEVKEYFGELAAKYGIRCDPEQVAWYCKKLEELGPDDMKQEFPSVISELFYSSIQGAYFKDEVSRARREGRIGQPMPHDPTRPVHTYWDIGEDCTAVGFAQTDGVRWRHIDYWEEEGGSIQSACAMIHRKREDRGFIYGKHYGPHDLDNRDWGNHAIKRKQTAKELGVDFLVVPQVGEIEDAIEAERRLLNVSWIDSVHCGLLVERVENYRKRWNKTLGVFTRDYVHDMASHGNSALQKLAMGREPERETRGRSPRDKAKGTAMSA